MDYLAEVEERIKHKIEQIEEEMDNTHERENTDRLMPKIETLNWALNEILVLDNEGQGGSNCGKADRCSKNH
jgi:hypothetical protein